MQYASECKVLNERGKGNDLERVCKPLSRSKTKPWPPKPSVKFKCKIWPGITRRFWQEVPRCVQPCLASITSLIVRCNFNLPPFANLLMQQTLIYPHIISFRSTFLCFWRHLIHFMYILFLNMYLPCNEITFICQCQPITKLALLFAFLKTACQHLEVGHF